jgi:hypothetical protein
MQQTTIELPRLSDFGRHAIPHLLEATLIPLALFYGAMWLLGTWGALGVALVWCYGAIASRLLRGRRVPGVLVLGALLMTVRTIVAVASGSVFVYFLQPVFGTVVVAGAFLLSVPAGRPLAQRLAHDFCPFPDAFTEHGAVQRFFARISVLWGLVYLVNAALTAALLLSQPVGAFVLAKTVMSLSLTGSAIVASTALFFWTMRRAGFQVTWGQAPASVAPAQA